MVAVLLNVPVPPLVELTAVVVLLCRPTLTPFTVTVSVQLVFTPTVPLLSAMELLLAAAVTDPPQPFTTPGVLSTVSPPGSVSLNWTPVSETVLAAGLAMVNVTVVVVFSAMLDAPNAFAMVGGATTVSGAVLLATPVPPSVEVAPAVALGLSPAVVPVKSTFVVHDPEATRAPSAMLTLTLLAPGVAVTVPPAQPCTTFGELATTSPAGSVSATPTPFSVTVVFGFATTSVIVTVPFSGMLAALNDLVTAGGPTTVRGIVLLVAPVPPWSELSALLVL
jgi:hypothetical protein